ncbi:hypothetical protein KRP22_008720 [Phytophthora ramorum]|nr:Pyruvate kinase [Phytophthora ramorum]
MHTPSSAYDQLRVSGFPPVRLGSWHRYRSPSQEFADVFKPDSSSIAREPAHFNVGIQTKQILTPTRSRARKTKIICAIGPASWSVDMLGQLLDAGMNVARLNFSHGDHELHKRSLSNLREAMAARPGCHCAVLLDTKGPEIRSGFLEGHKPVQLKAGQTLEITTDYGVEGSSSRIACTYEQLPTSVSVGSKILCDDGSLVMTVLECLSESIIVRVHNDHLLEEKKNMNLPGAAIQIPGITEKDEDDLLNFAIPNGVDIVSGSFVRSAANLIISITDTGASTKLLAKYRPKANILAVTSSALTARQLSGVSRGVSALLVETMERVDNLTLEAIAHAKDRGLIASGDTVILVHGLDDSVSKSTNVVKVIEVGKQRYSSPKHSFFGGIHIPFT